MNTFSKKKGAFTKKNNLFLDDLKKNRIENSHHYQIIKRTKKIMDDYYLDGIVGLIPIIGDIVTQFFNYSFLYVAIYKIKSYRLTMAILFNSLIDILIGLIPYSGAVLDFVHRSYKDNFDLIVGFVEKDQKIIRKVNKQATWTTIGVVVVFLLIISLIWLLFFVLSSFFTWISNFKPF